MTYFVCDACMLLALVFDTTGIWYCTRFCTALIFPNAMYILFRMDMTLGVWFCMIDYELD